MEKLTPVKAIREKCKDCCAGKYIEIKTCSVVDCPIWRFRLGTNPNYPRDKKNPFLQADYFKGLENLSAGKVIKIIKEKAG